jgi:subtilase family protein
VHRSLRAAALLALAAPAGLAAQRPAVSPVLPRVWHRDTTLAVWLFVRPSVPLDQAAARAVAAGARVRMVSRWLHALGAVVPTAGLRELAQTTVLRRIQPAGRWRRPPGPDPAAPPPVQADTCGAGGDPVYGPSEMPVRQLNLRPLVDAGRDGTGVRIAILDGGFDTLNPAFGGVTVAAQYDFVFGDSVVRDEPNDQPGAQAHGTAVWSLFAGSVPGRLWGVTRGASYLLAKSEDVRTETRIEEMNYVRALEWADSIGVDIVSSSLGYLTFDDGFRYSAADLNGHVAVTTVAADSAAARGILVVTAAGNDGPGFRSLVTPGDATSVITVGAEDSLGNLASFSSRGPTADRRLKPDLTAPGVLVCVVAGPNAVRRQNGTSFATPLIAASAALVKQLHPTLGPSALREALRAHAANRLAPDSLRGWGRPDVTASATFPSGITPLAPLGPTLASITPDFAWTTDGPPPSETVTYRLRVARDSALRTVVVDTVTGTTSHALRQALKPGRPLFWRVDAMTGSGSTATTGVLGPIAVPPWATPTSLSAPGGINTPEAQPTLTWRSPAVSSPPGPLRYDVTVRRAAAQFADLPEASAAGLPDTTYRIPRPLERNLAYVWTLVVHAGSDTTLVPSEGVFMVVDGSIPPTTLLYQNFPNPFPASGRDSTCLWFDLAATAVVELEILDLRGHVVRRFVPGPDLPAILTAGRYGRSGPGGPTCDFRLMWDGRADDGREVPAGVYLYKFKAGGIIQFKRIVFRGRGH